MNEIKMIDRLIPCSERMLSSARYRSCGWTRDDNIPKERREGITNEVED